MPWTDTDTDNAIIKLKNYYESRFLLKKWFFPRDLAQALRGYCFNQPSTASGNHNAHQCTQGVIKSLLKPRFFAFY